MASERVAGAAIATPISPPHAANVRDGDARLSIDPGTTLRVHWGLRLAVVACFLGHGAFGIITKKAWVPYFAVWGIGDTWAWRLMPMVGALDVSMALLTLCRPYPAVLLWMTFWGFQTASLRPLSGEPVWELLERAGNFGVPLALLASEPWPRSVRGWFSPLRPTALGVGRARTMRSVLRLATAALLIGHGGFGAFMAKAEWVGYFGVIGIAPDAVKRLVAVSVAGWFEIALGLAVLARPGPGLLLFVFAWKVGTEALRVLAGEPVWEFVERGGSYAAPLVLFCLQRSAAPRPAGEPAPVTS